MSAAHWTRPLKDGGVEFFMRLDGQTMKGSASSHATYRDLRAMFEKHVGGALPVADQRPARGKAANATDKKQGPA